MDVKNIKAAMVAIVAEAHRAADKIDEYNAAYHKFDMGRLDGAVEHTHARGALRIIEDFASRVEQEAHAYTVHAYTAHAYTVNALHLLGFILYIEDIAPGRLTAIRWAGTNHTHWRGVAADKIQAETGMVIPEYMD